MVCAINGKNCTAVEHAYYECTTIRKPELFFDSYCIMIRLELQELKESGNKNSTCHFNACFFVACLIYIHSQLSTKHVNSACSVY